MLKFPKQNERLVHKQLCLLAVSVSCAVREDRLEKKKKKSEKRWSWKRTSDYMGEKKENSRMEKVRNKKGSKKKKKIYKNVRQDLRKGEKVKRGQRGSKKVRILEKDK